MHMIGCQTHTRARTHTHIACVQPLPVYIHCPSSSIACVHPLPVPMNSTLVLNYTLLCHPTNMSTSPFFKPRPFSRPQKKCKSIFLLLLYLFFINFFTPINFNFQFVLFRFIYFCSLKYEDRSAEEK